MSKFAHRNLTFSPHYAHPQQGEDVRRVQLAINKVLNAHKIRSIEVDGVCGRETIAMGRVAARALGLVLRHSGLRVGTQRVLRHPSLRTPAQRKRAKAWHYHPPRNPHPKVSGNTVVGGTKRERVVAAAMQAAHLFYIGQSHRFYSQAGAYTVDHAITGETPGQRSDCSQFVAGLHHSAQLPDPSGADFKGGYTGTLGAKGTYIKRGDLKPGDNVLYGPAPHHHVEKWIGNGDGHTTYAELARAGSAFRDRTVGHGSPPVDYGDIDMIADPHFSRPLGLD